MRIVLIVLIGLVLLFAAVFVVGGMLLDNSYELERSIVINASPEVIHTLTGDLARWDEWAPWKKHDPSVNVTLGDKTTGVGASQTWTSDQGRGELVFTLWDPMSGVEYDMGFGTGDDKIRSMGVISYEPVEGGTRVTWAMSGTMDMPIVGGYAASMMDKSVGPLFDLGLEDLKQAVEGLPKKKPQPAEKEE